MASFQPRRLRTRDGDEEEDEKRRNLKRPRSPSTAPEREREEVRRRRLKRPRSPSATPGDVSSPTSPARPGERDEPVVAPPARSPMSRPHVAAPPGHMLRPRPRLRSPSPEPEEHHRRDAFGRMLVDFTRDELRRREEFDRAQHPEPESEAVDLDTSIGRSLVNLVRDELRRRDQFPV